MLLIIPLRSHVTPYCIAANMLKVGARQIASLLLFNFDVVRTRIPEYLHEI